MSYPEIVYNRCCKNSRNVTAAIHIPMRYLSTTNPFLMLRRNSIEDIVVVKRKTI